MKVAHAIHGLGLGGAQKVIASIVRHRGPGFEHRVYSCEDGEHRAEIEEAGATVSIVPRTIPKLDPTWVWRLYRAMRRDRPDLVHTHLFGDSLHGELAARAAGVPVVLTLHISPDGWNRLQRLAYPWLLRRARRSVACADSVREAVVERYPTTGARMLAVPNGIELPPESELGAELDPGERAERLRRLGLGPEHTVFAAVGRLSAQKGIEHLLDAFALMTRDGAHPSARLVLLGKGELAGALERRAAAAGVGDRVVFAGFRDDVRELLPAFDAVVSSSLYEGLPIALLEAMAAGRCLVCTAIPGNLDAARPDREALVVPPADPPAMAGAMARAAADPELRARLGDAARRRFAERFTAEAMARRYEEIYREIYEEAHGESHGKGHAGSHGKTLADGGKV